MTEPAPNQASQHELGEETMELELTAEEQLELSRAAEAVDAQGPCHPDYETYIRTRTRRADLAGTVTFAALVLVGFAFAGWRALREPRAPADIAFQSMPDSPVDLPVSPLRTFVRVANPFDAGEVFEIPADMTEAEARDAIAAVLLQRGHERLQQGIHLQRGPRTRAPTMVADVIVTPVARPSIPD
jgi:hypothetical protein